MAILAALLPISEMGGKSSQTNAPSSHIDASNLWTFFQARTIRRTPMRTAAEEAEATLKDSAPGKAAAMKAQTERWRQTAQRYELLAGAAALTTVMWLTHLGGPGRRRCGVHDPGLRGADPDPSPAPKKRPAALGCRDVVRTLESAL